MGLQQLLEDLLGLDSYIQVNKTLIQKLGLHEAILISELYSERSYWRKQNKLRDDKWFFSTRDNLEENTGLTPYYQREALSKLITLGIVECTLMDTPAKKYYSIVDDKLLKALTACCESLLQQDEKGFNDINKNNKKEINIMNNQKSTGAGALAKHPRNFSKEKLIDELSSGKVIDEQTREKKKETEYDKCLKLLDARYDDPNLYTVLLNHLDWSYRSSDPKRIKTAKAYSKRLDDLDKLQGDKEKIVKQSLDKQWHCFYELQTSDKKSYTAHSESKIQHQTMSAEEAEALLAKEAEEYGVI